MRKKVFYLGSLLGILLLIYSFSKGPVYQLDNNPPLDPKIRSGVLPNGMKYFIRVNKLPANRAEFYIAHNVGAIQEEDDQNGLAHFTEHMAFNGTKNFPKKGILNYLEKNGVKFAENVNAGTGLESTVYNLSNVPLVREGLVDSCLLILHDWSNYIAFDAEEIESERGVIREEWRMYGSASERMENILAPVKYKGSKYAKRNVIGDTAVINHFKHQTIKDFYHKWYRTDLQAIVVVGDFDLDKMEAKIKKLFSNIPAVKNPTPKEFYVIPDNNEPLIATASDKEATQTEINIYFKHDIVKDSDKNLAYMRLTLMQRMINTMINQRMGEISRSENPPFLNAFCFYGSYTNTKDALTLYAQTKQNEALKGMNAILVEAERMKQFGFIQPEFERVKAILLRTYEMQYNDRDKAKNSQLVFPILSNFLGNEPNPGIEFEYEFAKKTIAEITLDELNNLAKKYVTDNNIVVTVTCPEKEGFKLPTEQEIKQVLAAYKSAKIEAYVDKLGNKKLIEKEPVAGKVAKTTNNASLGTTEWTLSNGMKVVFKTTDFKAEEVIMQGFSAGGTSLVKDEDVISGMQLNAVVREMGVGDFSRTDLTKILSGKRINITVGINGEQDFMNGNLSIKDFETAMQMVHLYFTKPRWNETEFNTWLNKMKSLYANLNADPRTAFFDTLQVMFANHHKRAKTLNLNTLNEVSFQKIKAIYADRFADAGNFTFIFTGTINPEQVKPVIEKYLASIPTIKRNEQYKDNGVRMPKGKATNDFKKENKTPRTTIAITYNFPINYKSEQIAFTKLIAHCLNLRYTEVIREEKGGTYSIQVFPQNSLNPVQSCNLIVYFDTDPAKANDLIAVVHNEMKKIIENGPTEVDLQKAREFFLKKYQENLKENNWWAGVLSEYYSKNVDEMNGYENLIKNVTVKSIQEFTKKNMNNSNIIEIFMRPL